MKLCEQQAVLDAIPGNWLDSLLTGPEKVLPSGDSYSSRDVERLLNAIRKRIAELPTVETEKH